MALKNREDARQDYLDYKETRGDETMSAGGFLFAISFFIAVGIAVAAMCAALTYDMKPTGAWIVAYFALAIPGCMMVGINQNVGVNLVGYLLMVLPTGAIIGPYVHMFEIGSVVHVVMMTVAITVAIGIVGALWPSSVEHWFGYLFAALLALLFADLSGLALPWLGYKRVLDQSVVDWFGIGVFSLWIFFDMNQAMRMPANASNAVFIAANMYLNMVNLFIRLLARTGQLAGDAAESAGDVAGSLDV